MTQHLISTEQKTRHIPRLLAVGKAHRPPDSVVKQATMEDLPSGPLCLQSMGDPGKRQNFPAALSVKLFVSQAKASVFDYFLSPRQICLCFSQPDAEMITSQHEPAAKDRATPRLA